MKKILNIVKNISIWIVIVLAVGMMIFTIVSVKTFDHTDRSLFGYKFFIVQSNSMNSVNGDESKGYFNAGDIILAKEIDPSELEPGDIISYISTNTENYGKTVTHMIKSLTTDLDDKPGFVTYGTTTGAEDANIVTYAFVLGKYQGRIPKLGLFFQFLKTTPGYIVCIFLPFLILILVQGFNIIKLFRKYKNEQMAAIEAQREQEREELKAERAAIAEERKKQEEMMEKLLELQATISGATVKNGTTVDEKNSSKT